VPATSVMSERVFSKVGLILANKLRNRYVLNVSFKVKFCYRLTSKKVRELLFLAMNSFDDASPKDLLFEDDFIRELLLSDEESEESTYDEV